MRTLEQALHDHELIVLRVLGEWMDLDLMGEDKAACVKALGEAFASVNLPQELPFLPPEEGEALEALVKAGGRMPVAAYSRQFGEVRLMGPGRLEREEPWYDPASAAEALWYRGFLYRAFDKTSDGMLEFYYLPVELLKQFPQQEKPEPVVPAVQLYPLDPPPKFERALTEAVDDMTTIIVLAQSGEWDGHIETALPYLCQADADRFGMLKTIALEHQLIRQSNGKLRPSRPAAEWLKKGREEQLQIIVSCWTSSAWNDLFHVASLRCEGSGWENDPLAARQVLLAALPLDEDWYQIDDLIALIKSTEPDFQRPDGDYDSWYIRAQESDDYLRGFEHWDAVEGALLRFLLSGPLFWLGMIEGATGRYHLTKRGFAWLTRHRGDSSTPPAPDKSSPLIVHDDGLLEVSRRTDRYTRFQASRIGTAMAFDRERGFLYQISASSLQRANEQGITPERVRQFLKRTSEQEIPTSLKRALKRWEENGTEARMQAVVILRVKSAEILNILRDNEKSKPYIGESLGDMAAVVRRDQWQSLQQAAAQLGLLLDDEL